MQDWLIHQDMAHDARGYGKEVYPIVPGDPVLVGQPQEHLVDQGGWLQGVTGALAGQRPLADSVKLLIDDRKETFESAWLASLHWRSNSVMFSSPIGDIADYIDSA